MARYTIPAGTAVEVKPVVDGRWARVVTTAAAHHDEYMPTTDGRYWVFTRDGLATRVEPHRVGRNDNPPPGRTPKSNKPKGKAVRAAKLRESREKAKADAREMKARDRLREQNRATVIRAAKATAANRAAQIEAETRARIEQKRAARAAELAANDAEWAKLVQPGG